METRSKDKEFAEFKANGEALGLTGKELINYIREEKELARKAEAEEKERVWRAEMEEKAEARKAEVEARKAEAEEKAEARKAEAEEKERVWRAEMEEKERVRRAEMEEKERVRRAETEEKERIRRAELEEKRMTAEIQAYQQHPESGGVNRNTNHPGGEGTDAPRRDKYTIRLPFLDDKDDLEAYLCTFERTAKLQEWPKEEWGPRLGALLKGKARDAYCKLPDEEANDYELLKAALYSRFCLTHVEYRKRFLQARRLPQESIMEYANRIELMFDRWYELTGKNKEFDELRDLLLQERFVNGILPDQARFVKEHEPDTLAEAVKQAKLYETARTDVIKSYGSKNMYPKSGDKKEGQKPDEKRDRDEHSGKATQSQTSRGRPKGGCFLCGGSHYARECSKGKLQSNAVITEGQGGPSVRPQQALCASCEAKPYSPHCRVTVEGREVDAMRDTGATMTVVDTSLVPAHCILDKTRRVKLASGQKMRLPIAKVALVTPYFVGETEVIIMKNPATQVLIGNSRKTESGHIVGVPVYPLAVTCAEVQTRATKQKREVKALKVSTSKIAGVTPTELAHEQRQDPTLTTACKKADERGKKEVGAGDKNVTPYYWHKGILYREHITKDGKRTCQVVVPRKYRQEVLRIAHDTPMAGHLGVTKTRARIWSDFAWPGICGDVRRYCASCDMCQRCSPKGSTRKVPLGKMPIIDTPFERVAVDLVGPLIPASDRNHKYVLTLIDYATRYVEAKPLKTCGTEEVAEALWEIWTRLGVPKEVQTDQGTQFTSEMMNEVNRLLNITGVRVSPWHPQANGLVEKANGTLKSMIKKLCQEQPKEWDRLLPAVLFAYREVPQESLQFSPFELLYGRTVRGPMQILRELWTNEESAPETRTTFEYVTQLRDRIEQTCALAHEHLSTASKKQAKYFNRTAVARKLQVGDQVLILLPERNNKLQMTWRGPFVVVDRIGAANYKIQVGEREKVYHINILKKYVQRQDEDTETHIVSVVMCEEDEPEAGEMKTSDIPLLPLKRTEGPHNVKIAENLTDFQKAQLRNLCNDHAAALSDLPGDTHLVDCEIKQEEAKPVFVRQYPLPHSKVEMIKEEVDTMLKLGVIEPAASPYSSPVVLVQKKDGSVRFCIDYRKLNQGTKFDAEPLPDIEHLFTKLAGKKYFSKIDLTKGYWQIPMKEEDKEKTAFTTPNGQFQWKVMPFGLKNAGAVFSRMMRKLLNPLDQTKVSNFIDDVMVATETWEEHLDILRKVFAQIEKCGLTARPSKCHLGFDTLSFLGHKVSAGQLCPEDDKVAKIQQAERPTNKKQLRSFLGLAGYYRKFVPNFATIALPLTDRTKKGQPDKLIWDEHCETAFSTLKKHLCQKPILCLPDVTKEYTLRTDASDTGLGAILLQDQGDGLQPLAYGSKKLKGAELKYSVIEKECMAVVWGVKKFEPYLYGTHFTLETDHQPLQYLRKTKTENGRLMRWAIQLQQHSFTVKVIPGKENVGADYLSRMN